MNRLTKVVDTAIAHQNATAKGQKEERDKKKTCADVYNTEYSII